MINKILKNKNGGTIQVFNYMCNARMKNKTAKILKGNLALSKAIFKSIEHKYKQKLLVGVLSFEEQNLDEKTKKYFIESFEETLLPDFKYRYNSLWIEHIDKNRLELNYIILQFDFVTKKHLTVYLDRFDQERVNLWVAQQNYIHGLSNSLDPRKKQTVENYKRIKNIEKYKELDRKLHKFVESRQINNRAELIALLNENNIKTKIYDNFLLLRFNGSKQKIKFKNSIYSNKFTSHEDLLNFEKKEIEKYANRDKSAIFHENQYRFTVLMYAKKKALNKKYTYKKIFTNEEKKEEIKAISFEDDEIDKNLKQEIENVAFNGVIARFKTERESKFSSLQRVRKERENVYKRAREYHENIRDEHERHKERLQRSNRFIDKSVANAYAKCRDYYWERQALLDAAQRVASTIEQFAELETRILDFRNKVDRFGQKIDEFVTIKNQNLNQIRGRCY